MPHLITLLTLALVAGLAGGVHVHAPRALAIALTLSAAWATALLAYRRGRPRLLLAAVAVLVSAVGWMLGAEALARALHPPLRERLEQRRGGFALDSPRTASDDEPVIVEGRLREDARLTEAGAALRLEVEHVWLGSGREAAAGGIALSVGGVLHDEVLSSWTAGRRLRAPVILRRPARYLTHGVPDQERALARRGIALVGSIKSAALVEPIAPGRWWDEAAAAVRARTRAALARHVGDPPSAAIATAILIGDRAGLPLEVERRLQEAGTYHVIAISGGNIAILAGVLLAVMSAVGIGGRLAALTAIVALSAYAIIAAGGPSVLRATAMAAVYLAVRLIDQRLAAANAIALTASVLLLAQPLAVVDVGFWLTFGATIALVTGASLASRRASLTVSPPGSAMPGTPATYARRLARSLWGALAMVVAGTVCVEAALAPIGAWTFQRVTIAGLALNLVALPAMTVVQLGAMGVVAADVAGWPALASHAGAAVHLGARALTDSSRLLDVAPWLTWRVPSPATITLALYYLCLVTALFGCWRRPLSPPRLPVALAIGLLLVIVAAPAARVRARGDGRLHVTMFDVGQGDALLVTFPNGRTLVVDAGGVSIGGRFDIGDRVIGPALRARGRLALDYLAVTHGDPDHLGGALALLRDFAPREVWWGVPVDGHAPTAALQANAEQQRAAWRTLQRGDRLTLAGVSVRVHHPPPPDWERQRVRNNDSLVLELRLGEVAVLLTGDIGREVERELLATLDLPPLVVLKVAHHGSATSSDPDFLAHVRPAVALIGVGRGNMFGHPVAQVLGRLQDAGAEIFRTDLDGEIEVVTDGLAVEVRAFTGRSYQIKHEGHEGHEGEIETRKERGHADARNVSAK